MGNGIFGEVFENISHENLSLFAFIWTLYFARIAEGGKEDNFYKVDMGNKWYDVELKVTIKELLSEEDMENFKEYWGLDIEKAIEEFKKGGLIEK